MNSALFKNIVRFITLVLLQILVLKHVAIGGNFWLSIQVLIYPLFILLLPFRTSPYLVLLLAFLIGLTVDMFYGTPGIHASASVFTAFLRTIVLRFLEPNGGYNLNYSPTKVRMGWGWFFRYSLILFFGHLLWYFSIENFTFFYSFTEIIKDTFSSFLISYGLLIIIQIVFNPLD